MARRNKELITVKSENDANDNSNTNNEPKTAPVYFGSDQRSNSFTKKCKYFV